MVYTYVLFASMSSSSGSCLVAVILHLLILSQSLGDGTADFAITDYRPRYPPALFNLKICYSFWWFPATIPSKSWMQSSSLLLEDVKSSFTILVAFTPRLERVLTLSVPSSLWNKYKSFKTECSIGNSAMKSTPPINISREVAVGIFLGKIRWWNDSDLASLNPNIKLPREYAFMCVCVCVCVCVYFSASNPCSPVSDHWTSFTELTILLVHLEY